MSKTCLGEIRTVIKEKEETELEKDEEEE